MVTIASLYPIMMELGSLDSSRKKLHPSVKRFRRKTSFSTPCIHLSFCEKNFITLTKHGPEVSLSTGSACTWFGRRGCWAGGRE